MEEWVEVLAWRADVDFAVHLRANSEGPAVPATIGTRATEARADFFSFFNHAYNTLTMEAWRDDQMVASTAVAAQDLESPHFTLEISGCEFDYIRLNAAGTMVPVFYCMLDNVYIGEAVPTESSTWGAVKALFQ